MCMPSRRTIRTVLEISIVLYDSAEMIENDWTVRDHIHLSESGRSVKESLERRDYVRSLKLSHIFKDRGQE